MAPEREHAAAAERFRRFFNESTACITGAPVEMIPHGRRNRLLRLACQLRSCSGDELRLTLEQTFTTTEHPKHGLKAHSLRYAYTLSAAGAPLLRWDWHPALGIGWPHLHVYGHGRSLAGKPFERLHLPTGRVTVERLIWLLIEGCAVPPLQSRDICRRVLGRNERLFEQFKTW